jgi:hypothetical protein
MIDAAAQVLTASKEPLTTKQVVEAMAAKAMWTSPGSKRYFVGVPTKRLRFRESRCVY